MIYHKHHIIPRHAGESDDPSNIVELSIQEHRNKISESKRGVKLSESHKEEISKSLRGKVNTESQKIKAADKLSKEWIVIDPSGNRMIVKNLKKFADERGLCQGNLVKVAQGEIKQSKGYVVSYLEEI